MRRMMVIAVRPARYDRASRFVLLTSSDAMVVHVVYDDDDDGDEPDCRRESLVVVPLGTWGAFGHHIPRVPPLSIF